MEKEKIGLYLTASVITALALWGGYDVGKDHGRQIGFKEGYDEGYQTGIDVNLSIETILDEELKSTEGRTP